MPNAGRGTRKAKRETQTRATARPDDAAKLSHLDLQQTAEKYLRMIRSSPDAITLRSLPERRYVEVNEGFTRLTGYSSDEAIGKTSAELNLWLEQDNRQKTLKTLQRDGEVHEEDFQFRTKSGQIRWGQLSAVRVLLNGQAFMLSITHDITNLKRIEEALRESEADFRSLVQDAPYGIYRVTQTGRFLQVNPALVRMLGYDSEAELLRCDVNTAIYRDPQTRGRLIREYWQKKDFREIETEWKRKDGQIITVRLTGRPVSKRGAKLAYFEVFAEDVTERRSLERQLLQSQKMDAIGRLAGGIAHDFNNLLGVILGHSEILEGRMGRDARVQKSVEAIRSAAERAAALTMQLLAFSRKQVVEPKIIDMNAALKEMEKLVRRVISEDIELVMRLKPDLGRVKIDPGQLDQVIMNLVVNARDAMPEGGKLVLQTANFELDETYVKQHLGAQAGTYVMLAVSDTGIGMDDATLSHIFEPFFTTKEKGKGTGLGLSTVYGIVKQAAGYVMPYSEPGQGTTMRIYFPQATHHAPVEQPVHLKEALPRGTETILLVEDETALRELTRSILEESGYTVLDAAGTDQALEIAGAPGIHISLLLTDVVMPGKGGGELAKRLTSLHPRLKVLFMSGYADEVIVDRGVLSEGTVLIQKPFTKRNLLVKVRQSLDSGS